MKILFVHKSKLNSRLIIKIFLIIFIIFLIIYSQSNIKAVVNSISLFFEKVFPSLFPFFVATELLSHTNIIEILNKLLSPLMKPLFNVSGKGAFPFIMGILSGYPTGAKIISDFRKRNICTKVECERLLAYTNNSGPLFIIGTVGSSLFFNTEIGYLLFITHILGMISVGIIFRFYKASYYRQESIVEEINISNFSSIFTDAIFNSFKTLSMIFGFIIFFSILINILLTSGVLNLISSTWIIGSILSFIEITNGINYLSSIISNNLSINIVLTSFFLGFGGLSVLMQVYSIISKTDLSIKPYIYGKLLHGFISAMYTLLFIICFPSLSFKI